MSSKSSKQRNVGASTPPKSKPALPAPRPVGRPPSPSSDRPVPWGAARISKPLQNAWKVFHSELILSEVIPTSTPANELLRQVVEGVLGAHRLNRKKRLSQEERADAQRATARLWELIGTVTGTFIDDK